MDASETHPQVGCGPSFSSRSTWMTPSKLSLFASEIGTMESCAVGGPGGLGFSAAFLKTGLRTLLTWFKSRPPGPNCNPHGLPRSSRAELLLPDTNRLDEFKLRDSKDEVEHVDDEDMDCKPDCCGATTAGLAQDCGAAVATIADEILRNSLQSNTRLEQYLPFSLPPLTAPLPWPAHSTSEPEPAAGDPTSRLALCNPGNMNSTWALTPARGPRTLGPVGKSAAKQMSDTGRIGRQWIYELTWQARMKVTTGDVEVRGPRSTRIDGPN